MTIPAIANSLGSATGLTDATPPFTASITFTNHNNVSVSAEICWKRLAPPNDLTLEFGIPTCETPASPSNPLLLYLPSSSRTTTGFNVQRVGGPADYNYRGSAIVVTNGLVSIEERWQTCQTTGAGTACNGHLFPRDSSLAVLTTGNMNLGKDNSNVDRIMGTFYAGCPSATSPGCGTTSGVLTSRKQSNLVGSVTGYRLCFAGGVFPCPTGGNVPSFFQVFMDSSNLAGTINFGSNTWTIRSVSRYWTECKVSPPTSPLLSGCDCNP